MEISKDDINKICRAVRRELSGKGMHGEGHCMGEGIHGDGLHTKIGKKAKQVSRRVKDTKKNKNLLGNMVEDAPAGVAGLAAGTAATAMGANPVTGALVGAAASEATKQSGVGKKLRKTTVGDGAHTKKKTSSWQQELSEFRKKNKCSLKEAMKACKEKRAKKKT